MFDWRMGRREFVGRGERRRMEENLIYCVVFFSRGSQRMDGGGKYEKRERKRTENERERERRERGNNTLFLLFLHTLVASIATIFATICCGATIVCCHL
jgi:hypothetical protein